MITITKKKLDELLHKCAELSARIAHLEVVQHNNAELWARIARLEAYLEEKLRWATVQRWFRERAAMQQSLTSCGSQVGHAIEP